MSVSARELQTRKIREGKGFIAALDQSGGSTPDVLTKYGIPKNEGLGNDAKMALLVQEFPTRSVTAKALKTGQVIGAILFERTMDSQVRGKPTADYLWDERSIVPFVKIDKGLEEVNNGVRMLKPMPDLDKLLKRAFDANVFGTKMRSIIFTDSPTGIESIVRQQFNVAAQILGHGLVPIIEPEVDIHAKDKRECETRLKGMMLDHLDHVPNGQQVIFKINLPEQENFYRDLIEHPKTLKVVAMSGGYSLEEACSRLSMNKDIIASFSRALTDGLTRSQTDEEFNNTLQTTVEKVWAASISPQYR